MTCILPRFIEYNTAPFRLAEASLIVPDFSIFVYTAVLVIISFSASFSLLFFFANLFLGFPPCLGDAIKKTAK